MFLDLGSQACPHAVTPPIELEPERPEVSVVSHVGVHLDQDELGRAVADGRFPDALLEEVRVDGALVDVEERHVAAQHLVEQDDELDEVRVGLLPEGLLAAPVEVIEERGDPVGESVGVEVVVKRIVAVLGLEAHLEVVGLAPVPAEDLAHPVAEVALDLQDQASDAPLRVPVPEGEDLLGEGIHARGRLAAPDRPEDGDAREEASLGNRKPVRT